MTGLQFLDLSSNTNITGVLENGTAMDAVCKAVKVRHYLLLEGAMAGKAFLSDFDGASFTGGVRMGIKVKPQRICARRHPPAFKHLAKLS